MNLLLLTSGLISLLELSWLLLSKFSYGAGLFDFLVLSSFTFFKEGSLNIDDS